MTKNAWILVFLFIVKVNIPFGTKVTYDNVRHWEAVSAGSYMITLESGKYVLVPAAFTLIEEK